MCSLKTASRQNHARRKKTIKSPDPLCKNRLPDETPERLKLEYKKNGLAYRQLKRGSGAAIYEVRNARSQRLLGYEVIKPILQHPWQIKGCHYSLREVYPNFEQFGTHGWYYSHGDGRGDNDGYRRALEKFKEVEARHAITS